MLGNPNPTCNDGSFNEVPTCGLDVSAVEAVKQKNFTLDMDVARKTPWIFGSEFLPDGRLLLADSQNDQVILLSKSFRHEASVSVGKPFDIAVINETTAIATAINSTTLSELFYIQLVPKLQLENEPRSEKTGLRGFRPGPIQTRLYSHTIWLEA